MGAIEVKNLTKYYGRVCALDNVSFSLGGNKIYGLLGRNGAGKTTLLNLITNRVFPTEGEITIDGENAFENDEVLGKVFYMTEMNLYPEGMRVKEIFKWTKEFYPSFDMDYAFSLCQKFALNPNKKTKSLSTGYNSISKVITTLSSNAEILIFDEPVLGMDANHRELFYKELISSYIEKPKTIIISTHIIEEMADILEDVIILKDGKVAAYKSVEELLSMAYTVSGPFDGVEKYIEGKTCINLDQMASYKSAAIVGELNEDLRHMAESLNLEISRVELQKLFIYLTNREGEEYEGAENK